MQMFILWALQAVLVNGQHAERATKDASGTATSNISTIKSASSSLRPEYTISHPTTAPPCCWFAGYAEGDIGVKGNFHYNTSVVQTVATVYSTILDHGDQEEVANVSTSYMAEEEIYTRFGLWIRGFDGHHYSLSSVESELGRLGVPLTLVSGNSYAGTHVYQAGSTTEIDAYV